MEPPQFPAGFPTTCWSQVALAGDPTALAGLCEAYWYPVYALIRRKGNPPDRAADLTRAYFTRLIEKRTLLAADPTRGRFRSFLRTDCTFFLADIHDLDKALKRGGAVRVVSISAHKAETRFGLEPAHTDTPERHYERDWAIALIDRALGRLEQSYATGGRLETFQRLKPILTGQPDQPTLDQVAAALNLTNGAVRTALHRLRTRFGAELRSEIADTLAEPSPEAIAEEIRDLFAALGR